MRLPLTAAIAALLLPTLSGADILSVRAGANYWDYDISGSARYKTSLSSNDIDVNDELGYDNGNLGYFYITLEHPVPFLPNVRISKTNIDEDANGAISQLVTYGNITFQANEAVSSEVQLDQTDITLFYSVLDNIVNVDLGLNAKYIDSKGSITGAISGTESADVSGWVPMVYAGVGIDLPFSGLSISADGSYVTYQDSDFYDYTLRVTYTSPWRVGADIGYRKIKLDLDDFDGSYANVEFDGPYAGMYLHF